LADILVFETLLAAEELGTDGVVAVVACEIVEELALVPHALKALTR
jgi:NhaP-type Na+/H+ or K+/H+ antiporter